MERQENLIEAKGLVKSFRLGRKSVLRAVDDVALSIKRGETYALVGESGSGKTTLGRLVLGICPADSGEVLMGGSSICFKGEKERLEFARKAQMVFQDSYASMNPRMKVGDIVAEGMDIHRLCTGQERAGRIQELLGLVGLSGDLDCRCPHELSGGQRQRVGIARALAVEPEFLVCDEPISSLDVSVQAQIINLLLELQKKKGLTYLFITHDLNMARHVADRIGVMYKGRIIESGLSSDVWKNPLHPYTQALLSAAMLSRAEAGSETQASMEEAAACRFAERCACARPECLLAAPELREIEKGHYAACHVL
ncbi:MAG TPA: ABC transporter ATP-binding protein [Clostridiaceae bacterium]|nr:ABC transporter ATP-binding protein [Clostridiaceae bacterium]